jgi:hypothetical protein
MHRRILLFIFCILLIVPSVLADSKIATTAEIDIYGTAKIQHTFQEQAGDVNLRVYSPESLDISDNAKFTVANDTLHLETAKKGTRIVYLSKTFAKKEGDWIIQYASLNPESVEIILPFSAKIKEATGTNVRSKDKTGQVIEWSTADDVSVVYDISPAKTYSFKTPFFVLLISFIILLIYLIIKKPWKESEPPTKGPPSDMFIHRIKGIKRPMVKRVIFALLILTYEHGDKLIDQSKIRSTLSKEGFKNISSHKSEISGIVHKELSWLIHEIGLKINIKKEAEKEYALDKNAKKIIKILRKENLIEK